MKKIAILQPCFIPWLGYFEQMARVDLFIYLDDVQFTKKDWRNVNQFKTPYGVKKFTVPVQKAPRETAINDILISSDDSWKIDLSNKLTEWYKKAPHFNEIMELVKEVLETDCRYLVDLNYAFVNRICTYLNLNIETALSSEVKKDGADKNLRIIQICKHFKADVLYDGKSAANFIDEGLFSDYGIEVIFQDFIHTPYKQLWGEFVPYMSVLDALMNIGITTKEVILASPVNQKLQKHDN